MKLRKKSRVKDLIQRVKTAFSTCSGFLDFIFHIGYQGFLLPAWFRKLFAKTEIHRAWLSGYYGGGIVGVIERSKDNSELSY
jgi:hypothetical protein